MEHSTTFLMKPRLPALPHSVSSNNSRMLLLYLTKIEVVIAGSVASIPLIMFMLYAAERCDVYLLLLRH